MARPILVAPSILSADFTRLGEEVKAVVQLVDPAQAYADKHADKHASQQQVRAS